MLEAEVEEVGPQAAQEVRESAATAEVITHFLLRRELLILVVAGVELMAAAQVAQVDLV